MSSILPGLDYFGYVPIWTKLVPSEKNKKTYLFIYLTNFYCLVLRSSLTTQLICHLLKILIFYDFRQVSYL